MKKSLHILTLAVVSLAAIVSCSKNFEWNDNLPDGQESITLRFASSAMTKADVDGVERENYVGSLQFFVFAANADGTVDDTAEYVLSDTYAADGTGWSHSASSDAAAEKWVYSLTKAQIAQLFPVGTTKVKVFAVANYTVPEGKKTWKDLNEIEVGATFTKDGGPGYGLRWPRAMQPDDENLYFVMTGTADVELGDTEAKVMLARLASKVTVSFEYEEVTDSKGVVWKPQPSAEETRVFLSNAICTATLGGPLTRALNPDGGTEGAPDPDRDVFEYAYDYMKDVPVVEGKQTAHYYTYPVQMEVGDDNQPYLKLVMMWYGYKTINGVETYYKAKEVYYKIALPSESICEPNHIYEYNVKVNIIGSDKEVLLSPDYIVKDWTTRDPISANVATGRYISLEIPKDEYDMYVDNININFVSSGTVIAKVDEIYQWNYSSNTATRDYFMQNDEVPASATQGGNNSLLNRKGITADDVKGWVTIPEGKSYLKINHAMDNRMTVNNAKNNAFDMAPYVYVVTLHLVDAEDDFFDRHVTITQYPALFVTSRVSNGYTFVNSYGNASGSVVCYDDRGTSSNNYRLGNIANRAGTLTGEGENENPNNYIITTTMLSDDLLVQIGTGAGSTKEATILGDPRKSTVDNLSNLGLSNYYPTNPDGTRATIAPKLLIASSYGVIGGNYFFNQATAEKRCAAYQENGYPAGRWRVPTLAEITFMMTLSNAKFIPSLFNLGRNDGEGYWCANGKVSGDSNALPYLSNNTDITAVRCVYDAWYWGEEPYQEGATEWLGYHDK
jgi:hypothetical protein